MRIDPWALMVVARAPPSAARLRELPDLDQLQALRLDAVQQAIGVAVTVALQTDRDLAILAAGPIYDGV
jgi:hypothetical protein